MAKKISVRDICYRGWLKRWISRQQLLEGHDWCRSVVNWIQSSHYNALIIYEHKTWDQPMFLALAWNWYNCWWVLIYFWYYCLRFFIDSYCIIVCVNRITSRGGYSLVDASNWIALKFLSSVRIFDTSVRGVVMACLTLITLTWITQYYWY
jgi:hypothetical protein